MDAAIYTRISEDDGTALGVARQEADCRREAERRGWTIAEVFQDNDVSATRSKVRPAYQRLLTAIRAGGVKGLVVWDVDRLTRTPRELEDIIDLADRYGLALANVGGDIDLSTPQGRMTARIKGSVARHEAEQMSRRLKRKFQERAEAGLPHGRVPYGFRRVDGRDVADPAEAAVIREAADRVLAGHSLRAIAADFTERGIHGPISPTWSATILRQMLKRPSLAGLRQYRGEVKGNAVSDAVITIETHDRLLAVLNDPSRRSNQAGSENRYLLSGIARCGKCGGKMRRSIGRMTTTKAGVKQQPPSYSCSSCYKVRRKQDDVDDVVSAKVIAMLMAPDAANLFPTGNAAQADAARARLAELDAKLAVIADDYAEDRIGRDQMIRMTATVRAKRDQAEREYQAALPTEFTTQIDLSNVHESWERAGILVQRAIVEALLEIEILPSGSGRSFDPELIKMTPKGRVDDRDR